MATRALSHIKKSPLVNAVKQARLPFRSLTAVKHGQPSTTSDSYNMTPPSHSLSKISCLSSSTGFSWRNLGCSPALGSVIALPRLSVSRLTESVRYNSTSGVYANVRKRFNKQRRNRGELKGVSDNELSFGKYALQALEPAWITSKQIVAGQLAIKRNMRGGKLFMRIFPHKPISLRPAETRMGRGKGNIAFWVAGVRAGRMIYEINGVPESVARKAITVAASKFPIRTRFVKSSA
ncbi:50S ribosomal protein L16, chloroplastic-like isoform X2 [Amaranthus tricolor]|nr:50S ribosomal protein L16, chloroplastic-like isoform X2 [Amaranthus tricolor]XP_057515510.1 50S ribosomal protein L16, chloroplastic-like isoform X2 [Amaranthus tricolor]XP_057515511.1 50S ribosomal protein L16, chloroplastic-like isoform X2 [Amaranthus tricolor]